MKIKIFFSIGVLLVLGCFKNGEQTTKVSGMVIDYGSKEPIEGVLVQLRDGLGGTDLLTGEVLGSNEKSTTITDDEGRFDVEVTGEWGAHLSIYKEDYWNYTYITPNGGSSSSAKPYDKGSTNKDEILKLHAFAWYSALIIPKMYTDSAKFWILNENWTVAGGSWTQWKENGGFNYSAPESPAMRYGNDYIRRKIDYKRDGFWHVYKDSIYIEKDEILHDTIYF